jgi:nucleoside-diphosphate-sugar epimerase
MHGLTARMFLSGIHPEEIIWMLDRQLPLHDQRRRKPDISTATKTLGWQPTIALEEGLTCTIAYFKASQSQSWLNAVSE